MCAPTSRPSCPPDPQLLDFARRIAARLGDIGFDPDAAPDRDLATVHLDSVENSDSRSVGGERLTLHTFQQLGLPDALRACGISDRDARIALSLLVARMLKPGSECAAHPWLSDASAVWELLGRRSRTGAGCASVIRRCGGNRWGSRVTVAYQRRRGCRIRRCSRAGRSAI